MREYYEIKCPVCNHINIVYFVDTGVLTKPNVKKGVMCWKGKHERLDVKRAIKYVEEELV